MSIESASFQYTPKILAFIYHSGNINSCVFQLRNKNDKECSSEFKLIELNKCIACCLINYSGSEDRIHHIFISSKDSSIQDKKWNINSTIIEIGLSNNFENELELFNNITEYENHEKVKMLFKFASARLKTQIRKANTPILHYLFNVQPNGKILSQNELFEFAKDFIVWLPSLIERINASNKDFFFYSEYIYFMFRKFWEGQIFGVTSLISAMYRQEESKILRENMSEKVKNKIANNNFSFPIDLEFDDMKFAEENLNCISQNIITCNDAYLAFLAGYQVSLHSKFIEITKEWLDDSIPNDKTAKEQGEKSLIDIQQFAEIFCNRIRATYMGREFLTSPNESEPKITNPPNAVIQKFVEFSSIFLIKISEENVKDALKKCTDSKYVTEKFISSLDFKLKNKSK